MLRRQFLKFLVFFASLGLVAAGLVGPATAARTSSQADFADRLARPARLRGLEPIVRTPTGFGVSRPLRDLPKVQRTDGSARAVETFGGALPRTADGAAGHSVDPVL